MRSSPHQNLDGSAPRTAFCQTALILAALTLPACSLLAPTAAERADAVIVATYRLDAAKVGEVDGVDIRDGGYSSLDIDSAGRLWVVTDRGPNLEATAHGGQPAKRFPLPDYRPVAERIEMATESIRVAEQRTFMANEGRPATGLPPLNRDPNAVIEVAYDAAFAELPTDQEGLDSEGITFAEDDMWVSEEYRPSLWRLDAATGQLRERYTPTPTGPRDRSLPAWLLSRSPNLGFEGIVAAQGYIYAALQGPIHPPGGDRTTRITRILRLDPNNGEVESYAYALEGSTRKIGDLAALPDGRLLVLEHGLIPGKGWSAEIYAVPIARLAKIGDGTLPPERFRDPESALIGGVSLAPKTLYVDLIKAGWDPVWEKPEGLAVNAEGQVLLVNDNDYGIASPDMSGKAVATSAETVLVVIE